MTIYKIRTRFIGAQLFVLLLALLYEYLVGKSNDYTLILIYSLWNALSYVWLFFRELKYASDFHPFQILALVTAQFIGFSGIKSYSALMSGENEYFGATLVNDAIYLGIIYLSLQHLILFGVFFYLENRRRRENRNELKIAERIKGNSINYYSWAIGFYVFVWLLRLSSLFIPLASISSVLAGLSSGGYIISLFFLTFSMIKNPEKRRAGVLHWLIVAVEVALVMNHGMKEEIIRTLVPYCIYLLIMYKAGYAKFNGRFLMKVGGIMVFVVYFVFPYVSIFRSISIDTGRSWDQISTTEALSEYYNYINDKGRYANDDEERSTGYLMSRAGAIGCNAFIIDYTQKNGTSPQFFKYCCMAIIPRIIWPNKPAIVIGGLAYALATGDSNWMYSQSADRYGTAVSLGYIGSCYFCFGRLGAIMLIMLHGILIWYFWNFFKSRMSYNVVALWAFANIVFVILKDFESFSDCGLNFMVFNLLYIFICKYLYKGRSYSVAK